MSVKKSTKAKTDKKRQRTIRTFLSPISTSIILAIAILLIVAICIIIKSNNDQQVATQVKDNYIYIGYGRDIYDTGSAIPDQIITSYDDYSAAMKDILLEESNTVPTVADFNYNNYALVAIRYNPCTEPNIEPSKFNVADDQISITFDYDSICNSCAPIMSKYLFYAFKLDKDTTSGNIAINYRSRNAIECN